MARIIDALADTGQLADTMIVFTSDNGNDWGEHRWFSKLVPYEEPASAFLWSSATTASSPRGASTSGSR